VGVVKPWPGLNEEEATSVRNVEDVSIAEAVAEVSGIVEVGDVVVDMVDWGRGRKREERFQR
jgi:mRNA degradation ribonuclease J1/J2